MGGEEGRDKATARQTRGLGTRGLGTRVGGKVGRR